MCLSVAELLFDATLYAYRGLVPNFNPCGNLVVGLLALAAMGGCPALNASMATASLTVNPTTITFGEVLVAHSQTQSGTLTNSNGTSVTISQAWVSGSEFQVTGLSLPFTLAAGQSVTFNVTFTPTTTASVVGAIFVTSSISSSEDSSMNPNSPLSIPLSGTGIPSPGVLQATSPSITFSGVQVGNNITQSETLTNSGDSSVSITQANLTGPAFSVSGLNLPLTLLPGQSFTFGVVFAPTSASGVTGTISVLSNASNSILTISLWGTGSGAGQLSLAAPTLDFGSVVVGTSTSLTGTLSAIGFSVTVSSATSSSSEYTLSGLSLPFTLAAGQSTPLTFTFTPQASGTDSARISFISNASNSPTVASLTGSGALSPHSVNLSWSPSTSAVVGYNIYRSGTSGGPYGKINSALHATTAYTDNTVAAGLTYYYVTTAVDASGGESVYSNQVQAVVPTP
jgi:Abnormal spindle-like microcephaly-assoc'd, ASPM-SPD-2-Hydin